MRTPGGNLIEINRDQHRDGRSMLDYVEKQCFPTRKNHARALDSMQASLEAEARAKAEALRIKKKLETVCLFVCTLV